MFEDGDMMRLSGLSQFNVDRVRCGNAQGFLYECFDPSWYRIDRWIKWWFFSKGHHKAKLTMTINGKSRSVRARSVQKDPRHPVHIHA